MFQVLNGMRDIGEQQFQQRIDYERRFDDAEGNHPSIGGRFFI